MILSYLLILAVKFQVNPAQSKMNGNKLKPKSPNLNPFLCQPNPIGPVFGAWGPTRLISTQKLGTGLGLAKLMYQISLTHLR